MRYKQLTSEERIILATLKVQGFSIRKIAKQQNRHHSTLYRELARNPCFKIDGSYRPSKAQRRTATRRRRCRRNHHYIENDFTLVRELLRKKWNPEQVIGHIRRHRLMQRIMSHETIYQYIWRDKAEGGDLWHHLRQSSKRRRKRYKAYDSRGRLANKRNISE
jgi:transposase, IS30 family